jgi:hypothetical protein
VVGFLYVTPQRFDLGVAGLGRATELRPLGLALHEAKLEVACGIERDAGRGTYLVKDQQGYDQRS